MKQVVNFRFSEQTIRTLALLQDKLHCSKTAIVEKALRLFAKKEFVKQSVILQYAGALNKQEADAMLISINENKHNKEIQEL